MELTFRIISLVFAIVLHEVAHGYAAYRLGDPTAKQARRLTLNPLAHIDLFGSILLPLMLIMSRSPVLFGWARPVPVNPSFFRDPRRGMMLVGAAGPATNLALSAISAVLFRLSAPWAPLLAYFLAYFCITNVVLGLFNLIPIPPLDGSRVLAGFLPRELAAGYFRIERFGFIIIFLFLWMGAFDKIIAPAAESLLRLLLGI